MSKKVFKKKVSKNEDLFLFFIDINIIRHSPFRRIIFASSLYLSSFKIRKSHKKEFNDPTGVSILLFVLHFIFREKRDKSKNKK